MAWDVRCSYGVDCIPAFLPALTTAIANLKAHLKLQPGSSRRVTASNQELGWSVPALRFGLGGNRSNRLPSQIAIKYNLFISKWRIFLMAILSEGRCITGMLMTGCHGPRSGRWHYQDY